MLHAYTRLFIHLVWSTKHRQRWLTTNLRPRLHEHLLENARSKHIAIDTLAVQPEHVHVLLNLQSNQQVDDVVKLLKGESSHWINAEDLVHPKFSWQRGYGAFSLSSSHVDALRTYITNQDEHHRNKSFAEEYEELLLKYGFTAGDLEAMS